MWMAYFISYCWVANWFSEVEWACCVCSMLRCPSCYNAVCLAYLFSDPINMININECEIVGINSLFSTVILSYQFFQVINEAYILLKWTEGFLLWSWNSSQDCFKASWSLHKSVHLKAKLSSLGTGIPDEQNSESVSDGWLYCLKKGQARTPKIPHFDWTG